MKTSDAGRKAITQREGNKLKAYQDTKGIWTIGVGHTAAAGSPAPKHGMVITAAQSDAILARDLADVEAAVNGAVKVPLSQNQFDALVSLAFNIGNGAFRKSTLVKRLNAGDVQGAADAFLMWNKPPEIMGRRRGERKQFLTGTKPIPTKAVGLTTQGTMIAVVQAKLAALGYNPGAVDGKMGPLTRGAVLSFKNDNGITPVNDTVDASLLAALDTAKPRHMAEERAKATTAEVAAVVPEVRAHWWTKYIAAGAGAPAAIAGAADYIAPARGYIDQIKDYAADVPSWVWLLAVAAVCGLLFHVARSGEKAGVEAYREGERR